MDPRADLVSVDGDPVPAHPALRYFALNKPAGVTTTLGDRHAARPLSEFLPEGPRVFPVGRLDRESEGLLLLTNDGTLAYRLQHPRYGVEKEYLVDVTGDVPKRLVSLLVDGIPLTDGMARAARAAILGRTSDRSSLRVVMVEGRKREVRRMLETLGYPVRRLVRVRIGSVKLRGLPPGALRPLVMEEIAGLYRAGGLSEAPRIASVPFHVKQ